MKKKHLLSVFVLCSAFCASPSAWASSGDGLAIDSVASVTQSNTDADLAAKVDRIDKALSLLPKFSGYLQTGYTWADENAGNTSSFQMKRMRLIMDKQISPMFDFRAQFEVFSGSFDGNRGKKVMTIMDAFVNMHINKALHFRVGQYYMPLGFENYDISPATVETVDFSNINYRMVCRNAASSTANYIDYGRDIGIMAYGDLLENKEKGFNYLSYELSVTNGHLPTLPDNNKSKDVAGRITIRPIDKLRIIGSYNWGEYQGLEYKGIDGQGTPSIEAKKYLPMNRFIVGAWYNDPAGLSLRAEYGHIKSSKANVKEDGFYLLAAYRFDKLQPVARWDMYRDKTDKGSNENRDNLLIGLNYDVVKAVTFQLAYTHSMYTSKAKDFASASGKYWNHNGNGIAIMCRAKF